MTMGTLLLVAAALPIIIVTGAGLYLFVRTAYEHAAEKDTARVYPEYVCDDSGKCFDKYPPGVYGIKDGYTEWE